MVPVKNAHVASGREMIAWRSRTERAGQPRRTHGQPKIAPTVAPKLFVTRSINEHVRFGANNWASSTVPLRNAPVHIPTATATMTPVPRRASAIASRNPQGTNRSTFP